MSGGKFVKLYAPLASVVVVANTSPLASYKVTVTPDTPGSVASWMPSPLVSIHTKLPKLAGCTVGT
ncbi:MAG: hypothetical protein IPN94_24740 [Sphingobacteriales bacterium]|nr:hypothetical protein [Sphingobacteriales bacterium]